MFGNEYNQIGMEMFFINTDVQLFLSVSSCVTTYEIWTSPVIQIDTYNKTPDLSLKELLEKLGDGC